MRPVNVAIMMKRLFMYNLICLLIYRRDEMYISTSIKRTNTYIDFFVN